jgi:hypothetical protein
MSTHAPAPVVAPAGREDVTVITTDRWEDVRDALAVVHDGFVAAGYMRPQPSGRRMIGPYLNDGVTFSIAYIGDEIAGVLGLMPDGAFGLPSDSAFGDLMSDLRVTGSPLFECGSLVVAERWRRHTRTVLAGLAAANMRVFRETPGAISVISAEPRQQTFYESLFGAGPVSDVRDHYGAPAVLLASDYPAMVATLSRPCTNGQRLVSGLVLGADTSWLTDRRQGERWPVHEVAALMDEQVGLSELLAPPRAVASG